MIDDLRRRVVDAMLAVDVANGGKADMYMLADAALGVIQPIVREYLEADGGLVGPYDTEEEAWAAAQRERRAFGALSFLAPAGVTEGGDGA